MDILDALVKPCHDLRQGGVDELHKQTSALGYAMQSGQDMVVDKVRAAKLDPQFFVGMSEPIVRNRAYNKKARPNFMMCLLAGSWSFSLLILGRLQPSFATCSCARNTAYGGRHCQAMALRRWTLFSKPRRCYSILLYHLYNKS